MNLILLYFTLILSLVYGQEDFQVSYVIGQMDRYCDLRHSGVDARAPAQSVTEPRVGKAGPRGPQGVPGPPAEVDYPRIERVMDQKLQAIQTKMAEMERLHERQMSEIKSKFELQDRQIRGLCKVEYQGKCFWAIKTTAHAAQARELCESEGGHGANIYDATHLEKLRTYLLTLFSNENYLFTGMNYSPQEGVQTFADESVSSFKKWYQGYPNSNNQNTVILFNVRSDPNSPYNGMFNYSGNNARKGVICEI